MKRIFFIIFLWAQSLYLAAAPIRFGETLCHDVNFVCLKVKAGQTWDTLFPTAESRDLVQRVNRMNIPLRRGMRIAIPNDLDKLTLFDVSPFPRFIPGTGEKVIFVSQRQLAWGAFDEAGELIFWGPISSGIDRCKGSREGCRTPTGHFRIIDKQNRDCFSSSLPGRDDDDISGAAMPFCMHFLSGFALHGSETLPGFRASHGCLRLFTRDARWLNEIFITAPEEGIKGTRVVIDDI